MKLAAGSQKIQKEKKAETEEEREEKAEKAYQKAIGYKYGIGETPNAAPNAEEYKKWCELAAEYGNCRAIFELGDIYERGIGVKKDKKQP